MSIPEETRKAQLAELYFHEHKYLPGAVKNVDFCVKHRKEDRWLFLAEAKRTEKPLALMLAQLILTMNKAFIPEYSMPKFIGVFDCLRICFIPIAMHKDIIGNESIPDVPPSRSGLKKFKEFQNIAGKYLYSEIYNTRLFELREENEIREYIASNVLI